MPKCSSRHLARFGWYPGQTATSQVYPKTIFWNNHADFDKITFEFGFPRTAIWCQDSSTQGFTLFCFQKMSTSSHDSVHGTTISRGPWFEINTFQGSFQTDWGIRIIVFYNRTERTSNDPSPRRICPELIVPLWMKLVIKNFSESESHIRPVTTFFSINDVVEFSALKVW